MGVYGLIQALFLLSLVCFPTFSGICSALNLTHNSTTAPPQASPPLSPPLAVPKSDPKNESSKASNSKTKESQVDKKSSNASTEKTNHDVSISPPTSVAMPDNKTENNTKNVEKKTDPRNVSTEKTNHDVSISPPAGVAKPDNKTENNTKNVEKKTDPRPSQDGGIEENCDGKQNLCPKQSIKVCLQGSDKGSNGRAILVQNEGGNALDVNITLHVSTKDIENQLKIYKHQIKKVKMPVGQVTKVTVHTGSNECVFSLGPVISKWDDLFRRPSFDQLATPVNGAYLLIITVAIFGVAWACCRFTKRRWRGGVAYQELEMGSSEIPSVTNIESAEGWDEGWDDDWDDEVAVKSQGRPGMGNISANGLSSRAANGDGWENDWND